MKVLFAVVNDQQISCYVAVGSLNAPTRTSVETESLFRKRRKKEKEKKKNMEAPLLCRNAQQLEATDLIITN